MTRSDWAIQIGLACTVLLVDSFIGSKRVRSDSMFPKIRTGSLVFYQKIGQQLINRLKTNDVVVFTPPDSFYRYQDGMEDVEFLVKRIVAMKVSKKKIQRLQLTFLNLVSTLYTLHSTIQHTPIILFVYSFLLLTINRVILYNVIIILSLLME